MILCTGVSFGKNSLCEHKPINEKKKKNHTKTNQDV